MLSPMAKGLFHRAIMQSGSALSPWAVATDAGKYSRQLAQQLGCLTNKSEKNSAIVNCLRQKPVNELLSVKFKVPTHLISFGPTIDGIVVPNDPSTLMADSHSLYGSYDLMFGITKAEAYNYFTTYDERHGIDANRRDRILRTLVRNLFNFHLQEIFLTIANEYTDWSRPTINALSIFESVSDALSDALVTSAIIKSGLLHSKQHKQTFFYNFAHSTEVDDYHWRIGSTHGEDLLYVFGAPLVSGTPLGFLLGNYTKAESALSENVINYWSNFARSGDPNNNVSPTLDANNNLATKSKSETKHWQRYEEQQQYYLMLMFKVKMCSNCAALSDIQQIRYLKRIICLFTAAKPKIKDHYQSHRLSYWLNLIPRIHVPGVSSAFEHHLLEDFENPVNYEGIVREMTAVESLLANQHNSRENSNSFDKSAHSTFAAVNNFGNNVSAKTSVSSLWPIDTLNVNGVFDDEKDINNYLNGSFSMIVQETTYSTALSVTIAIGCSLLVLNILVFAGVFYHRDRGSSSETVDNNKTYEVRMRICICNNCMLHSFHVNYILFFITERLFC
ncbi:Neuroligin-4: X-linked-like protein [Leptotrombidium deliense]|uniref:Neuroligin-4: X-linked-like protein n=1 Tax=Leptotrombidium deliense TaxID=299467 RepID=A0A443S7U8_9ACAR|nr:Neuroligin-4: X-linked-like protein [Leptotrombidium deliense]